MMELARLLLQRSPVGKTTSGMHSHSCKWSGDFRFTNIIIAVLVEILTLEPRAPNSRFNLSTLTTDVSGNWFVVDNDRISYG